LQRHRLAGPDRWRPSTRGADGLVGGRSAEDGPARASADASAARPRRHAIGRRECATLTGRCVVLRRSNRKNTPPSSQKHPPIGAHLIFAPTYLDMPA
jgi:hypothetical protein